MNPECVTVPRDDDVGDREHTFTARVDRGLVVAVRVELRRTVEERYSVEAGARTWVERLDRVLRHARAVG